MRCRDKNQKAPIDTVNCRVHCDCHTQLWPSSIHWHQIFKCKSAVNHSRSSCAINTDTNPPVVLAGSEQRWSCWAGAERGDQTFYFGGVRECTSRMMSVAGAQPFIKLMQPPPSVSPGIQRRHTLPASEVRPLNTQDAISVFEIEREGKWPVLPCSCILTQGGQIRSQLLLSEKKHYADSGLCVKPFVASTDLSPFVHLM